MEDIFEHLQELLNDLLLKQMNRYPKNVREEEEPLEYRSINSTYRKWRLAGKKWKDKDLWTYEVPEMAMRNRKLASHLK